MEKFIPQKKEREVIRKGKKMREKERGEEKLGESAGGVFSHSPMVRTGPMDDRGLSDCLSH